jgi:hypothetical protein
MAIISYARTSTRDQEAGLQAQICDDDNGETEGLLDPKSSSLAFFPD